MKPDLSLELRQAKVRALYSRVHGANRMETDAEKIDKAVCDSHNGSVMADLAIGCCLFGLDYSNKWPMSHRRNALQQYGLPARLPADI